MNFLQVYDILFKTYGSQQWWPARTPFEVMLGAVLTQNTAWSNVEKAIANLYAADALDAGVILRASPRRVAAWLRPAGYFNVKAKRLRNLCDWYVQRGGEKKLRRMGSVALRNELLAINGVGPETADDILLYAFQRPVFVIDAYTRRIFSRLRMVANDEPYDDMRGLVEQSLRDETLDKRKLTPLFNEYHALIVRHGKEVCRPRPRCTLCCLAAHCPTASR